MTKSTKNSPNMNVSRRAILAGGAALSASLFLPKNLRAQDYPTDAVNTTDTLLNLHWVPR